MNFAWRPGQLFCSFDTSFCTFEILCRLSGCSRVARSLADLSLVEVRLLTWRLVTIVSIPHSPVVVARTSLAELECWIVAQISWEIQPEAIENLSGSPRVCRNIWGIAELPSVHQYRARPSLDRIPPPLLIVISGLELIVNSELTYKSLHSFIFSFLSTRTLYPPQQRRRTATSWGRMLLNLF